MPKTKGTNRNQKSNYDRKMIDRNIACIDSDLAAEQAIFLS